MITIPRETRICPTCNKEFEELITRTKRFCSVDCLNKSRTGRLNKLYLEDPEEFSRRVSEGKKKG